MECQLSTYCKLCPKGCNILCSAYVLADIAYKFSNIPARYQYSKKLIVRQEDEDTYNRISKIISSIDTFINTGSSILLYGSNKGNGKTTLACLMANAYIRYRLKNEYNLTPIVYFIKSSKFLEDYRQQFKESDGNFKHVLDLVENIPLLIIDDIGAEKPTDWVKERLLDLIDERYGNNRSTIFTSNCDINMIESNLGERISDRIREYERLEFKSPSMRGM